MPPRRLILYTGLLGAVCLAIGISLQDAVLPALLLVSGVAAALSYAGTLERRQRDRIRRMIQGLDAEAPTGQPGGASLGALAGTIERATEDARARLSAEQTASDFLRDILETIDHPVIATEPGGRVITINGMARRLTASRGPEDQPERLEDAIVHAELNAMHDSARRGSPRTGRLRMPIDGATRWFDVSCLPVGARGAAGYGVVVSMRDVTELATTVQLKTDFAANASHELRTPIASIRAAIETMGEMGDDLSMHERLRGMIENGVTRLENLIADLLDLSRLESEDEPVRRTRVDLGSMMDRYREEFSIALENKRLELLFEPGPEAHELDTDEKLLDLILRNLIENAIKFSYEDTSVRVVTAAEDGTMRLDVIDRGIGIPLPHQQRIFERFYQIDAARSGAVKRRGTGLGLSIVKHAIRRLSGTIEVHSVWQQGATMRLRLPREPDPASP